MQTWRESPERVRAAHAETPAQHVWHFARHFTAFTELFSFLFLDVSFRDSLSLEGAS